MATADVTREFYVALLQRLDVAIQLSKAELGNIKTEEQVIERLGDLGQALSEIGSVAHEVLLNIGDCDDGLITAITTTLRENTRQAKLRGKSEGIRGIPE